jgi:hypothetical protein
MLGYIVGLFFLYLFLQFQIDKIRNPTHPHKINYYKDWIDELKNSVKPK